MTGVRVLSVAIAAATLLFFAFALTYDWSLVFGPGTAQPIVVDGERDVIWDDGWGD